MIYLIAFGIYAVLVYLHFIARLLEKERDEARNRRERIDGVRQANAYLDAISRGDNPPYFGS